jgi:gamma-glutamyltranspeptidase/glutathione hydrolase
MIVSGHPGASLAGLRVMERGGNVVDATIATSAALTVMLGHATSIGGDGFLLFHNAAENRTLALNGSGVAPLAATPERFSAGIPLLGPTAALVPGLMRVPTSIRETP